MSWTTRIIDEVANTYRYATNKFRTPDKAPRYVGSEVMEEHGMGYQLFADYDTAIKQRTAMTTSWIYSNIIRIGNEVSSSKYNVMHEGSKEKDIEHPFEHLLQYPNPFFEGTTLLKYVIWSLSLDPWGAYWFLAPDKTTGELSEIWPIPMRRMVPVKHKTKYISHYIYTSSKGVEVPIRPEFVVRFMYPNPLDLWRSLTPLEASTLAIDVYQGITTSQRDLYTQSRGTPLSVLSLDPNISDPDFARAREVIRDDWEQQRRVAIVRAGTLDIESVGFSNTDLRVIESQEFTRDEIDAIFMGGIQWRRKTSSGEREEINKEIKDIVIYPLLKMIGAQIQLSILGPWYPEKDLIGEFDDVRAQDRSLGLQENTIYFRSMTVNETREKLGLPAIKTPLDKLLDNDEMEGSLGQIPFGDLPYALANNPSFVTAIYKLAKPAIKDPEKKPEEIGNLEASQDPEALTEDLAGTGTPKPEKDPDVAKSITVTPAIERAMEEGIKEELKRYRKVMRRAYRKSENPIDLITRVFDSEIIPWEVRETIQRNMAFVESEDDIDAIFAKYI